MIISPVSLNISRYTTVSSNGYSREVLTSSFATAAFMTSAAYSSYVTAQRGAIESCGNFFYDLQGSTNLVIANIPESYMTGLMTHERGSSCDGSRTDERATGAIGWSTTTTDCYN